LCYDWTFETALGRYLEAGKTSITKVSKMVEHIVEHGEEKMNRRLFLAVLPDLLLLPNLPPIILELLR